MVDSVVPRIVVVAVSGMINLDKLKKGSLRQVDVEIPVSALQVLRRIA